MNLTSPIKPKKAKENPLEEELKKFKKPKCTISKATAKRISGVKNVDSAGCAWFERWIDQLIRERAYPPQLKSDDFYSLLGRYFEPHTILEILEKARTDFKQAFPLADPKPPEDDLSWVSGVLKADPNALIDIPHDYLL